MKKYQINTKTAEDVEARIAALSRSYTPEWLFKTNTPDIGSTIGRIFARQMHENMRAVNEILEIYHTEFVNFLDLTLKKARPAGSICTFSISDLSRAGVHIPKGTRILTEYEGESGTPVFETEQALYVTSAQITDLFLTDYEAGVLVPLLGEFPEPELFDGERERVLPQEQEEEEDAAESLPEGERSLESLKPFLLFGERKSIGRHALLIGHDRVFDAEGDTIRMTIKGNRHLAELADEGRLRFSFLSEEGLQPFAEAKTDKDRQSFLLKKEASSRKIRIDDREMDVIIAECSTSVLRTEEITDIRLKSSGGVKGADYVGDGSSELNAASFAPFTESLNVYAECYIGKDNYFDKAGASVTMTFRLLFRETVLALETEAAKAELKIIKRREKAVRTLEFVNVFADEIALEYYNGVGWKRLRCDTEYGSLFRSAQGGEIRLTFTNPEDWEPTASGAYDGRLLRLRLMQSDNCYMRPAVHHYPVMEELSFSYFYEGPGVRPEKLIAVSGTERTDLTASLMRGKTTLFRPIPYAEDALYLGFDKRMESGPVGIFFELASSSGRRPMKCRFEYGSRKGFQLMKVIDRTEGFSRSGIVLFLPPPDFHRTELEKKSRYWIRIVRGEGQGGKDDYSALPKIKSICLNAVDVTNIATGTEEDYYIDEVTADMRFALGGGNILDAEVFVNERDRLTAAEMEWLKEQYPDDVRAEYDLTGDIAAFYVRWHETEKFLPQNAASGGDAFFRRRVYRIDRLDGFIEFSDGIMAEIPRVTDDVAFRVRLRTCVGADGNLPADSLVRLEKDIMFIDGVTNPVRSYGGNNMETVPQALVRGSDLIHSRGRIVSERDFKRAILSFSDVVDKVHCVRGFNEQGEEDPSGLSFVLLMKDFADGAYSFHRIRMPLKKHLLASCDMAVTEQQLHIMEPVFVSVSVSVWTRVLSMEESFEVQNTVREALDTYLNPVTGGSHEKEQGWKIGSMPKKTQILMQLSGLKGHAEIRKTSITASYTDRDGDHEMSYEDLQVTPYMVCKSGEHRVHILYGKEKMTS
ncbi:MAG: hypothetical protein IK016_03770 [Lachnospiraceae bacterium]|nr:hypothetical protein [Lachnospiraceae bacterium]